MQIRFFTRVQLAFIQGSFVGSKGPKSGDIGKAILLFNQTFPIGMMGWYLVFFLALPGLGADGQVFKKRSYNYGVTSNIISTDFGDGTAGANTINGSLAAPLLFEATTAPGDSGGPVLVQVGSEWVIAGVLSGGTTATSVYGDVSSPRIARNDRSPMRLLAFCLLPNHFHLLAWPAKDRGFSKWTQRLMTSHVRRYHRHYGSSDHVGKKEPSKNWD